MKGFLTVAVALLTVFRSPRPVGSADAVRIIRSGAAAAALAPEPRTVDHVAPSKLSKSAAAAGNGNGNGTDPCDRHLRSTEAEVEVRNPRNHKFVTSNGWTDRQRPRPEINVYSRIEELPSSPPPPPPPHPGAGVAAYYQQQRDNLYQHSRQQLQPTNVRTSKRIIYYATLPDVVRVPVGYPPQPLPSPSPSPGYPSDPYAFGPSPFSADFRQLDPNRNSVDQLQRNRVAPYENAYNRGGPGVTSVTSKSTYNSRYDEPAEFRDSYYRPNEFTSKFASWAEPFYKSWTSSAWDRDPTSRFSNRDSSPFPWDREPLGNSLWDANRGLSWDANRRSPWDANRGSSWDTNRGSSWDKELVEVPLQQKPGAGAGDGRVRADGGTNNKFDPEVTVVQSGVIDVRGDRGQQNPSAPPPGRFTIVDVDPRPYRPDQQRYNNNDNDGGGHHQQRQPHPDAMRYDAPQKPTRYETYTPMQPPTRYEHDQPQRFEQQYRAPPSSVQQPPGNNNNNNGYYEKNKNHVNTHQFMTSWTEVSTQNEVSPTHSVSLDISTLGNSTSLHNNTRIVPYTNSTKTPPK